MILGIDNYKGVSGFNETDINEMCVFLQGAVYCWCKNRSEEWFAARDLIGGENNEWEGTPLFRLYTYYLDNDDNNYAYAVEEAGKAAGRLLKKVLFEDRRVFETEEGYTRMYRWTGEEQQA